MKHRALLSILLLTACKASFDEDAETFETSAATGQDAATGESLSTGQTTSMDASSESGTVTTSGDGDGDSTGNRGDGDSDDVGDGDGDSASSRTSPGDGDGDAGDGDGDGDSGSMSFPGDPCDPFNDDCLDGYFCHVDDFVSDFPAEFRCREFGPLPDQSGLYGTKCNESRDCQSGFKCVDYQSFPDGECDISSPSFGKCCIETCAFDEVCPGGSTCEVIWWAADLEDYLDPYVGIGACTVP